jgi:hypothetical protein
LTDLNKIENGFGNWAIQTRLRLARRREKKPDTKAGQIRALWPEIAAALEGGQSVKSIRQWPEGTPASSFSATSLTSYISRIRRRELATQRVQNSPPPKTSVVDHSAAPGTQTVPTPAGVAQLFERRLNIDPIAQAMRALTKRRLDIRRLHSDGDPTGKALI